MLKRETNGEMKRVLHIRGTMLFFLLELQWWMRNQQLYSFSKWKCISFYIDRVLLFVLRRKLLAYNGEKISYRDIFKKCLYWRRCSNASPLHCKHFGQHFPIVSITELRWSPVIAAHIAAILSVALHPPQNLWDLKRWIAMKRLRISFDKDFF